MKIRNDDVVAYGEQLDQARAKYSDLLREYIRNMDYMTEEEVKVMQKKLDESGEQYQRAQDVYFTAYMEAIESARN